MLTKFHQIPKGIFNPQILTNKVGKLEKQDVHLWRINSDNFDEISSYSAYYLNIDEQNRAQRFRFRKHRDMFVIGRYLTKVLIAHYTNNEPDNVSIFPDEFGKPVCEMELHFNLSHSGNFLLLGFSNSRIGVDIEKTDTSVDIESISESHFTEAECHILLNSPVAERTDKFFEIWTKKESLIKGIGKGLSLPLQKFNVTAPNAIVKWEIPTEHNSGSWYVHALKADKGYKSAFATQNKNVFSHYFLTE